jgi:hypothetical protein
MTILDDAGAAERLLAGIIIQAKKDVTQKGAPPEMVPDAWNFLQEIAQAFENSGPAGHNATGAHPGREYIRPAGSPPGRMPTGAGNHRVSTGDEG